MEIKTLKQILENSVEKYGDRIAFQMKRDGKYRKYTYKDVATIIRKLQGNLVDMGVGKGDRVAIMAENRPEWPISYLAVTTMGAVAVPLDAMLKKDDILPLIVDSEPKAFILSTKYLEFAKDTKLENKRILMEEFDTLPAPSLVPEVFIESDQLAAIIYTSGTTGAPKGVMLSHGNLTFDVIGVCKVINVGPGDNFLSVLPLHHTFENTAGFWAPFHRGCTVTYAESLKSHSILENMQETGVTVMCGVPLLYKLFYDGIMREVAEKKIAPVFSALFAIAKFFRYVVGINLGKILFSIIQKKFGGKIKFFVSGGAPINAEVINNFELMGFTILQGYGLTESAPIITCTTLEDNKIGSVGKPLPGVEVKIAGNDAVGEILASGPNIMKGYYKRKDLSDKVLINGWLYTGDLGYMDEEGHLYITGRSKDIIVTGSGVNVYPEEIEFALNKMPEVKESCILGEKMKEGTRKGMEEVLAIIVPNVEYFEKLGKNNAENIRQMIEAKVGEYNKNTAHFKRIERTIIRKEELPKTRILKIKRFELKKEYNLS